MKNLFLLLVFLSSFFYLQAQTISITDGSATWQIDTEITGTGCLGNALFDAGNGIDQLFGVDWYIGINGGLSQNFPQADTFVANDTSIVAQYTNLLGVDGLNAQLTYIISEFAPLNVQVAQIMQIENNTGSEIDIRLFNYLDLDKNNTTTEDAVLYLQDDCNLITQISNVSDPTQLCYYAVNASDGFEILDYDLLCSNLESGLSNLNNTGLPLLADDYTQALQFNSTISIGSFSTAETLLTFGTPPEPAVIDVNSGQCSFISTPPPEFLIGQPIQNCEDDGSFTVNFAFSGNNDGTVYTFTETNISGVLPFSFTDDGSITSVNMGPYPLMANWNIEVTSSFQTEILNTFNGIGTCTPEINCLTANLSSLNEEICSTDTLINLNALVDGMSEGTWVGPNISDNVFNSSGLNIGNYELLYIVEDLTVNSDCPIDTAILNILIEDCDCAGVPNGSSSLDDCGVCDDNSDNDNETCADCAGVPNGSSSLDDCGVCDDNSDNDNETCADCAGVPNGSSSLDDCGVCDDNSDNDNETCADCAGVPNGSSSLDDCGVCDDNSDNDNETCADCAGVPNGSSSLDDCGVCDDNSDNDNETCADCAGVANGSSSLDDCGVCDDNSDNDNETCIDCNGTINGTAEIDDCGNCLESTDPNFNVCFDCSNFTASLDIVCSPQGDLYQIIFILSGDQTSQGYDLVNNQTGDTIHLDNPYYTTTTLEAGLGYSYTIILSAFPECNQTFSASFMDCTTTAIELLNFKGEVKNNTNKIYWSTASEKDSKHFTLERSRDGINFSAIAEINANGNSNSRKQYDYLDKNVSKGIYHYRLLETDIQSRTQIVSEVISLNRGGLVFEIKSIAPIPAIDFINIDFISTKNEKLIYETYDVTGKIIASEKLEAQEGLNTFVVDVNNYPTGTYFLKITSSRQGEILTRFVKK